MIKRVSVLTLFVLGLAGCGGSSGPTDNLFVTQPGSSKWIYSFTGTVQLLGNAGQTQSTLNGSTFTMSVPLATSKDANNTVVNILDRQFNLLLADGSTRVIPNFRLYFTQSSQGIFVHGVNVSPTYNTQTIDSVNDRFVPGTATPPYKFTYLPNPASNNLTLDWANPFGSVLLGSYDLTIGATRVQITTPAGTFVAKPLTLTENFDDFSFSPVGTTPPQGTFSPGAGIVFAQVNAIVPDGTTIQGTITLLSVTSP